MDSESLTLTREEEDYGESARLSMDAEERLDLILTMKERKVRAMSDKNSEEKKKNKGTEKKRKNKISVNRIYRRTCVTSNISKATKT